MSWIIIAILAYFFLAIVNLVDKFLIDKVLPSSAVYSFLISSLSGLVILFSPWFLIWPGYQLFFGHIFIGALFPLALFLMFEALKRGEASKITVLIGGLVPLFTIIFSLFFWQEKFSINQWLGIFLLLGGTFFIAVIRDVDKKSFSKAAFIFSLFSAFAYSLFFLGTKYGYDHHSFASSFIWLRLGCLFGALFFLLFKKSRHEISNFLFKGQKRRNRKPRAHTFLILGSQALGAAGSVLQNYAISFGSVAIISALQGVQYGFLLIAGIVLTILKPKIIKENIKKTILIQKILAIFLISLGLYFMVS